jgi:hypothetical protein
MARTTTKLVRFDQGMRADLRSDQGEGRVQHFQVFPHKLVPQFSTKADENNSLNIVRFLYGSWLTGYKLWGLGTNNGGSLPAVYNKGILTGNLLDDNWTTPSNNVAGSGARDTRVFFEYKAGLFGFRGGTALWRFDTAAATFTDTFQSVAYSSLADPVHHPADDCAYFFADNKVYRLNNTTWDGLVLTLPSNLVITSCDAQGDYLAIGCKSVSGAGNSVVFLWDRDSSLSTVSAKIDWGKGDLIHLANLEGVLVGVTDYFTNSFLSHSKGKAQFKRATSGVTKAAIMQEFITEGPSYFTGNKHVVDDKLHFPLEFKRDGAMVHGVWSVDAQGRVEIPMSESEADAITDGLRYQGIYKTGNYWWLAHSNDGSVNRTDDQNNYSATSIYETTIIGSPDEQSQLVGATLSFEPLPSGATATLKFRKVGTTSWTTLKSESTAGAKVLSATKDASGAVPTFNEAQFRLESTGGAIITGLEYTVERNDKKPYGRG